MAAAGGAGAAGTVAEDATVAGAGVTGTSSGGDRPKPCPVFLGFAEDVEADSDVDDEEDVAGGDGGGLAARGEAAWAAGQRSLERRFPLDVDGKVGGKPLWLNPCVRAVVAEEDGGAAGRQRGVAAVPRPDSPQLQCGECKAPLFLLLQVFAPLDDVAPEVDATAEKGGAAAAGSASRNELRVVYVFACRSPACHVAQGTQCGALRVIRCSLSTEERAACLAAAKLSAESKAVGDADGADAPSFSPFCVYCGQPGSSVCSCGARYCTREHQRLHWALGHKQSRGHATSGGGRADFVMAAPPFSDRGLFAEFEIVSEPDDGQTAVDDDDDDDEDDADDVAVDDGDADAVGTDAEQEEGAGASSTRTSSAASGGTQTNGNRTIDDATAAGVAAAAATGSAPSLQDDLTQDEMRDIENRSRVQHDKVFAQFRQRTAAFPDQVMRYYDRSARRRGDAESAAITAADPHGLRDAVWVTAAGQATDAVPPCENCGGPRVLELQIMPQLLHHLGLTKLEGASIDWGTLAIFTCARSCAPLADPLGTYYTEVCWRQAHAG